MPILIVLMVLFAVLFFVTNIFSKDFDKYYNSLSEAEQKEFELELQSAKPERKVIMTSKALVHIDFIVIKAFSYDSILSMKIQGRIVMLNGNNGMIDMLKEMPDYTVDAMVQELLSHNEKIVWEH